MTKESAPPEQDSQEQAEPVSQATAQEHETLKKERDEWKDKCLRIAADFENYKKRSIKDREQWQQLITTKVLGDVLAIVDDVERAVAAEQDGAQGLQVMYQQLLSLLQAYNVQEITEVAAFNPELHEAVTQVPSQEHASGAIIEVLQKGYRLGDVVLRPAKVAIAQ